MTATPLYVALVRPASWRGLPVMHWLAVFVIGAMTLQLSKSFLVFASVLIPVFAVLRYAAWRDPWWIENWITRLRQTPPHRNALHWGGNSYGPW